MSSIKAKDQTLIITRPEPEAERLAKVLENKGYSTLISPLITLKPLSFSHERLPPPSDIQGFLASSPSLFRFFSATNSDYAQVPMYVSGQKTAERARKAGFLNVISANGDGQKLLELCQNELSPTKGVLVWLRGRHTRYDFLSVLENLNFSITPVIVYDSICEDNFNKRTLESLKTGTPHGICLFSPRTAQSCARALEKSGWANTLDHVTVFCLSQAVAAPVQNMPWQDVQIASHPSEESFLSLL